jgi:hypothetical protein
MFLRYFKSSFASQYISIGVIGLILWARAFINPPPMPVPEGPMPFYSILYDLISGTPMLGVVLGYLLVTGSAFLLNSLFTVHEIVPKNTSLSAFLFILFMSYIPFLLTIQPLNICVFLLILILKQLFNTYNRNESLDLFFMAGFFTGIGSFFYFPFIIFFAFILISFIIFRSTLWREWMSGFIGLMAPYAFLAVYYFWFDLLQVKISEYEYHFRFFRFLFSIEKDPTYLVFTATILAWLLFGLFTNFSHLNEKTIETRKKNLLLSWSVLFIVISFPFAGNFLRFHLQLVMITISAFVGSWFLQHRKTFWQELVFLLLFIAIVLNNLVLGYL